MVTSIAANPHELLRIRRDSDRTFDRTVEVWRIAPGADGRAGTEDGKGGRINTFARYSSGPGRIAPLTNREATFVETTIGDRLGGRQPFMATVAHDRSLRLADQLRSNGQTFEVVGNDTPRSYSVDRRVVVVEIT